MNNNSLRLILVEDNPSDAELIVRRLEKEGFSLLWTRVENEQAYNTALGEGCDLILSDWSLPDFSGMRALEIAQEKMADISFIIISGRIGEEAAVAAMRQGASDYLLKDRLERLGQAVDNVLEKKHLWDQHRQAEIELRKTHDFLNNLFDHASAPILVWDCNCCITHFNPALMRLTGYNREELSGNPLDFLFPEEIRAEAMTLVWNTLRGKHWDGIEIQVANRSGRPRTVLWNSANLSDPETGEIIATVAQGQDITDRKQAERLLKKATEGLRHAYDATLQGWSNALEMREHETAGHSNRVVKTTLNLARRLNLREEEMVHIQRGALLHDIGKMGIPDSILLKPGPLDEEEWAIMRQHPIYAYNLLAQIPYLKPALDIPYYHHERWDGSGYPKGLKGEQIPLSARIFSVVDVWDALSFDRPYRSAWNEKEVLQYIEAQSGILFDPHVVEAFLEVVKVRTYV